jgi:uncharacterized repeat protein (TIGR01451 family)
MKRLVLRIAALGVVVVLGLIAIAQAQRGSGSTPPAADESTSAGDELSDRDALAVPSVGSENRLRATISDGPGGNPFRGENRREEPNAGSPPANVLMAGYRETAVAVEPAPPQPLARVPSADPLGLQADPSGTGAGPAAPRVVRPAGGPVAAPPPQTPRRLPPPGTHDPQFPGPSAPAEASLGRSLPPGPALPLAGQERARLNGQAGVENYADARPDALAAGEPARFVADPLAVPAGGSPSDSAFAGDGAGPPGPNLGTDLLPGGEGNAQPGSKELEGPQTPQLTIQKSAPPTLQVGKAASFRIMVRNTGRVAAHEVEVHDRVPKGTRLVSTNPRASRRATGELVWALGTLRPGDESSVEIQLEPIAQGEIGSVATVRFQAETSARSVVTKPELVLQVSAPAQVLSGEEVTLTIEVSNPGSGVATGVVVEEHVPAGLQHPAGGDLEYLVGELPPGESRKLALTLTATRPGPVSNVLTAQGEGNLRAEGRLNLEVIAPLLEVAVAGPKRRYLEREAIYQLSVHNPGTAPAEQVELVAYLPQGLKFVRTNNSGHYEQASRTVHWRLEELPTKAVGTVELVTLPIEAGQQTIRLRGTADRGVSADGEQPVLVEGIAAIKFVMVDATDPIEVGGETIYEIRVVNQGSKAATNVRLTLLLPPEMRAVAGEGPTRYALQGSRVLFEGLPRLAPKADVTYRVRAQGLKPGDLRICAQLLTDEMQTPVVKEESTRVYSDE